MLDGLHPSAHPYAVYPRMVPRKLIAPHSNGSAGSQKSEYIHIPYAPGRRDCTRTRDTWLYVPSLWRTTCFRCETAEEDKKLEQLMGTCVGMNQTISRPVFPWLWRPPRMTGACPPISLRGGDANISRAMQSIYLGIGLSTSGSFNFTYTFKYRAETHSQLPMLQVFADEWRHLLRMWICMQWDI